MHTGASSRGRTAIKPAMNAGSSPAASTGRAAMTYTTEELQEMLRGMRAASSAFYRDAQRIGCHPFLEFTGLLNEYIQLCEAALALGQDFTETSVHGSGEPLPMREHNRDYLNEKLECIYGMSLDAIMARPRVQGGP